MDHTIHPELLRNTVNVMVVGCGGNGSAIATGLPYLHQALLAYGHPGGLHVTLVDGDTISATNCIRQPFCRSEIGLPKSVVLANRLNLFWGLDWEGLPDYLSSRLRFDEGQIVIGCVDSSVARGAVREWTSGYSRVHYWLDLGNKSDGGQFVLGEPLNSRNRRCSTRLRTVAELFPEIANTQLPDDEPSCSAPEASGPTGAIHQSNAGEPCAGAARTVVSLWSHLVPGRICELGEHGARATITD
jgi:PRTRC genetic system ThiF family protein